MRLYSIAILCALATPAAAELDKSIIRGNIRAHMREFRACYEKALEKNPKLEGMVTASFVIIGNGTVEESTATGLPGVDACVAKAVSRIKFPALPRSKGTVKVNYPFEFRPR
jgi:outer membrane biosynthesis protein TonB